MIERNVCVHPCDRVYVCPCGNCWDQCSDCGQPLSPVLPASHVWTIRPDGTDLCVRCDLVSGGIEIGGILND